MGESECIYASQTSADFINRFGAVVEEFEVRDAILAILAEKDGNPFPGPVFAAHEIPAYA